MTVTLQGSKGQARNAPYSLRRQVVPSKHFEDFYLERQPQSKKEHLETGEKLTCKSGEGSASSSNQSPLPVSILPGETLSYGENSSALPQLFPKSSLPNKDGCESTSKVSESTLSTVSEASEHVGPRKKQAKLHWVVPCKGQVEQVLETSNGTQVINQCSPEQKSVGSLSVCHREPELGSKTPLDFTPQVETFFSHPI